MNRKSKSIILFIVALLFFYSCTYPLFTIQKSLRLTEPEEGTNLKRLPPELVFTTVLLGGFRGILVDFLWLRAQKLQQDGKYFELVQLSDWIGLLEPYIPEIWTFNAWNLSYNVSVEFPAPEERWNWLYQGIKLLRDKALKYVPKSAKIYEQMSWIYYHKISSYSDTAHAYYKKSWARLMKNILGDMPLEEIALNSSYEKLLEDKNVEKIVSSFQEKEINILKDLDQISKESFYTNSPEELKTFLDTPAFRKIEAYLRAKKLSEEFKLDPEFMLALEEKYFPLDWKSAATHSLYWIEEGKRKSEDMTELDYRRRVYLSLNHLLEGGIIGLKKTVRQDLVGGNDDEEILVISPNLQAAPILNNYYEDTLKSLEGNVLEGTKSSHRAFLEKVIMLAYTTNNLSVAHKYYNYLKDKYPRVVKDLSFSDYVSAQLITGLENASVSEITNSLIGLLYQSYWFLALGEDERAAGFQSLARLTYERVSKENTMFKNLFPTFEVLRQSALETSLNMFPAPMASSLRKRLDIEKPAATEEQ